MANIPAWFNANDYFRNKLAALNAADNLQTWNDLTLRAAFSNAGYDLDADGMYQHYTDFGQYEGVSPNALFNVDEYLYAKAVQYYAQDGTLDIKNVTSQHAYSMWLAISSIGMTPWQHYLQYGAAEGINPSASFDSTAYLNAKLAQLQSAEPSKGWTLDSLQTTLNDAGLTPLEHYYEYGISEGLSPIPVTSGITGQNYNLTTDDDAFYGTPGDDYFHSKVGTLNDRDFLDGGEGNDTLYAYLNRENNGAVSPTVLNVENIKFRAQETAWENGSNNVAGDVHVDAGDILGMTYLASDNSRASLIVEDVRTNSNNMTIAFLDSDPGYAGNNPNGIFTEGVNFNVYFNPQNLKAGNISVSGSIDLQLMDVKNAQNFNQPLTEQPFDAFILDYNKADGTTERVTIKFRAEDEAKYTGETATYASLLEAFRNGIADLDAKYAGVFSVALGGAYTATATVGNSTYTSNIGQIITLAANSGSVSVTAKGTGWGVSSGAVPGEGGIVWNYDTDVDTDCPLIQTNIHLDNVGRVQWNDATPGCLPSNDDYGSESGNMVVGSMADRGGVERFDVVVDRGSWLNSLSSTNNTLRMVTAVNGDINGDGVNGNLAYQANDPQAQRGQLYIGDSTQQGNDDLVTWHDAPRLLATNGLTDVKYFDGSTFEGKINIGARILESAYDKYLNDVDGIRTIHSNFAPNGEFKYALGSNDDTLNMLLDGGIAADRDFKLVVNGGAGDDFINFRFDAAITQNQILNIATLRSVELNGDAGNDTIRSWGNGAVTANGGAGKDTIYVGQTQGDTNAVFLLNADMNNAPIVYDVDNWAIYWDQVNGAQPLNNDIQSTVPRYNYTAAVAGTAITVTVDFKGLLSKTLTITTPGDTTGAIDSDVINMKIIEAINNDDVLSKLLVAKDGAGYSLLVESLIDGAMVPGDLTVIFGGANLTIPGTTTGYTTIMAQQTFDDGLTYVDVDGNAWGTDSINRVNGGADDDVIVLNAGSDATFFDTVHLGSSFGNDVLVNFTTGADKINVRSLLSAATAAEMGNGIIGSANSANVFVSGTAADAASHVFTVQEFLDIVAAGNAFDVSSTSLVFLQDAGTNVYSVFQVTNDATAAVTAQEVTLVGSLTLANDLNGIPSMLTNGDLTLA